MKAIKTDTAPIVDGDLSDPTWKSAPRATTFLDRMTGSAVADQTTAYLLYDDRFVYVAFYCQDAEPDKIIAREVVRDSKYAGNGNSEDNIEVLFDPFRTHRWEDFTLFSVNALGTPSARLGGGRASKTEWKGDWQSAAKRVADGWTAEMRIPWSILNYPSSKQPITMGINFTRFQYRTRIESIWSNTGTQGFNELEGLWTGVQVPAAAFRPRLSVLPYLLPGSNSANRTLRTGLDARYTLTPELTLVGSINPDFSTIERSVEGIAFTRGERYVSDRRPFFLEGRDYFESGTRFNDIGAFFYPNRIQSFDFGTKMYGKITPRDALGLLQTSDFGRRIDTIARYRHDLSATAQVGLFLSQTSSREDNNTVVMADQRSRWGKFSLESQWSISMGRDAGGGTKVASFVYEDKRNFTLLQYQDLHERFRNANGFFPFTGYRGVFGGHAWFGEWRRGPIQNYFMVLFGFNSWHTDGRPFMRGSFFEAGMTTRSDMNIGLSARHNKFDDQTDATVGLRFTNGASNRFRRYGVYVETGKQGDRAYTFLGPDISLRVLRRLDLFYGGSFVHLDGSRQQHILSLIYEISPTRSFGGRLVTQNGGTNWYLSYRHSGEKGTEVYLILGDPNASRFTEQALVKIVFVL